ncbi:hypothetical protein [Brevibacillus borstelensis]|uniref:hypothetical protein n=1 Tax=Brevibacillus borstelensis TaxID=45462 RepID=UPI0030C48630
MISKRGYRISFPLHLKDGERAVIWPASTQRLGYGDTEPWRGVATEATTVFWLLYAAG